MATLALQVNHHPRQSFAGDRFSGSALADIIILAVFTGKIASGEKNSTGSMTPYKSRLFSEMRSETGNDRKKTCLTKSLLIIQTVDPASPRTDGTGFQQTICFLYPLCQLTGFMERDI
jgi:hypothetical protein